MSLSELSLEKIQALATAIVNKINSSISTHNSSSSAHSQGSANGNKNLVTDANGNITTEAKPTIPSKTSDLTNDSGFLTSHQDISGKEDSSNKVSSWSSTVTDAHYPSEKLVKNGLDAKASSTHTHGSISNDGKIGSASGKIITTGTGGVLQASDSITKSMISDFPSTMTPSSHTHATSAVTNEAAYDNILSGESTTLTLDTQAKINAAINTKIGALQGLKFLEVTTDKGTASASTMNKLYIESKNNKVDAYYTTQSGNSYSWNKLEEDILEDVSISWSDVQNKPESFTPSSHTHGNLTNDGKIGTTSGKPIITTTGGAITTGAFGTSSGQFAEGNHTHNYTTPSDVQTEIQNFADALAAAINPSS